MQPEANKIKVAIADDHTLFRKGIIKLLDKDRYELIFDVQDGQSVIEEVSNKDNQLPDIIIMDIEMPNMNGYETVAWLRDNFPDIKILVVSMLDREETIFKMLKLGVKGYLSKDMEPEDLHAALVSIFNRNYYYTDFITNKLIHAIQQSDNAKEETSSLLNHQAWASLNSRQKEFVRYACTEMIYEEIADKMCVSPKTIDGYRDVVFEKFNVKSRVALILYAIRNGLVSV
ncbi:MAG: response regulator transcription factor [Chitinophagaceae bacterium]|nr:response regulator transcription factor [Chitinophagaceae bacterium]